MAQVLPVDEEVLQIGLVADVVDRARPEAVIAFLEKRPAKFAD